MATFAEQYETRYHKAAACLTKDREALLAVFDVPAEHWDHLRTANPIESVFATVRHRTVRTKGALSQKTAKPMVFTLIRAASKSWRRLSGANQLPLVVEGIKVTDGVAPGNATNRAARSMRVTQNPAWLGRSDTTSRMPCIIPMASPARHRETAGKIQLPAAQGRGAVRKPPRQFGVCEVFAGACPFLNAVRPQIGRRHRARRLRDPRLQPPALRSAKLLQGSQESGIAIPERKRGFWCRLAVDG